MQSPVQHVADPFSGKIRDQDNSQICFRPRVRGRSTWRGHTHGRVLLGEVLQRQNQEEGQKRALLSLLRLWTLLAPSGQPGGGGGRNSHAAVSGWGKYFVFVSYTSVLRLDIRLSELSFIIWLIKYDIIITSHNRIRTFYASKASTKKNAYKIAP